MNVSRHVTLTVEQSREVARLHRTGIPVGFLSSLGTPFLACLYRAIACDPQSAVVLAEKTGRLLGFAAGTVDTAAMYRRVLRRQWFPLAALFAHSVFSLRAVRCAWETLAYGCSRRAQEPTRAELLAIVVDPVVRGAGVGRRLIAELESFFESHSVETYTVVTSASDPISNAFYRACGFSVAGEFTHHGRPMQKYVRYLVSRKNG